MEKTSDNQCIILLPALYDNKKQDTKIE